MIADSIQGGQEFPFVIELDFSDLIQQMEDGAKEAPDDQLLKPNFFEDDRIRSLRSPIRTKAELAKQQPAIDYLMRHLFPSSLALNEIKAATIPFTHIFFYKSKRFANILDAAGEGFELEIRNLDRDNAYIMGCCLILGAVYQYKIDFYRPLFFDIPDAQGKIRHYRLLFNADFVNIKATESAPPITDADFAQLMDHTDDIGMWREKFPPNSYVFKGFGIANMFDSTVDEALSQIRTSLISRSPDQFEKFKANMRKFYNKEDIEIGIVQFDKDSQMLTNIPEPQVTSIMLGEDEEGSLIDRIPSDAIKTLVHDKTYYTIPDVDKFKDHCPHSSLYHHLKTAGAQSFVAAPLVFDDQVIGFIEISSKTKYYLNGLNATKLDTLLGIFSVVMQQAGEDYHKLLEVIIQEECTSIHPSVSWRFEEEAAIFHKAHALGEQPVFKDIIFEDVYPLYGQCDIRGSSVARNNAVIADLLRQLAEIDKILDRALQIEPLPLYNEVRYRLDTYATRLKNHGLVSGLDQEIISFIRTDVHPIFKHLSIQDEALNKTITAYHQLLDPQLHMIYDARKNYDQSVTKINKVLAAALDEKAEQAQQMFPHFFERYKTDGVEFNIYIGQSLVKDRQFDPLYLQNLKLWQLTTICELELLYARIRDSLATPLDIASLILAYSEPLSIRFRMDEKRFDVDGAYNARYEIIKKRIDKAHIKGTDERITQAGQLTVIYHSQSERMEYEKYAQYLQAIDLIEDKVENHLLEDLQGVTGLKALRFTIKYPEKEVKSSKNGVKKKKSSAIVL